MFAFFKSFIAHPDFFKKLSILLLTGFLGYKLLESLSSVLEPFVYGFIGAYLLNKIAIRLDAFVSRGISATLLMILLIALLTIITAIAAPYIKTEIVEFSKELPMLAERLLSRLQKLFQEYSPFSKHIPFSLQYSVQNQVAKHYGDIIEWFFKASQNLLSNSMFIANTLSFLILTPFIMFYFLKDWKILITSVRKIVKGPYEKSIFYIFRKIDDTLSTYLMGQSIVCVVLSALYIIGLLFTGLSKAWLIGLMSGLLSFVPYLGLIAGLVTSLSLAFADFSSWGQILAIFLVYVIIGFLEGKVIVPYFVGKRLGLHPLWILFSVFAGGTWFGFEGVILSIPIAAILLMLFKEFRHNTSSIPHHHANNE